MGGADDWYIRLAVVGGSPDLPQQEYSLDQFTLHPGASADVDPSEGLSPRPEYKPTPTPGVVLGRLSPKREGRSSSESKRRVQGFPSPIVSRDHARLTLSSEGKLYVEDLGSMHGTVIEPVGNETPLTLEPGSPTQLIRGDILRLGRYVQTADTTHKPVRLRIIFRYPAAGELHICGRHGLLHGTTDAAIHLATNENKSRILDLKEASGFVPDEGVGVLVKDEKTVIEVHSPLPVPTRDHAALESFAERRSMDEFLEAKRKVYGVPYSVLYPDSDDDEDLPRGRRSEERARSNMTLGSSRGSRHATYSPDHVHVVPPIAPRLSAQSQADDLKPALEEQAATSPAAIHSVTHIGCTEQACAPPRFTIHDADPANVPVGLVDDLAVHVADALATPARNVPLAPSQSIDADPSMDGLGKDGEDDDKAPLRHGGGSDYEYEWEAEDDPEEGLDKWGSNDSPTEWDYDVREEMAQRDDYYVQNGNEYHEHNGLFEDPEYVDDDDPDFDLYMEERASQTVIHSKTFDFDDEDLDSSECPHSGDYEDAEESDDGSDGVNSSDSDVLSDSEKDDVEEASDDDEDSADGESLSERSTPKAGGDGSLEHSSPNVDRWPNAGLASQGKNRKPLDDASEPGSPPSSQSDYGRWYSYSTDHEEEDKDNDPPVSPMSIKQETKDVVIVEVIETTEEEADQGDDEPPEMLPIEKESAPEPLFTATSIANATEPSPPPKQNDTVSDAAESVQVHADFPSFQAPALAPPSPSSSDISSEGPVTPPLNARTRKRKLPGEFDEDLGDFVPADKSAKTADQEEPRAGMARALGLVALGMAIGSVSTIAGLMQLAD